MFYVQIHSFCTLYNDTFCDIMCIVGIVYHYKPAAIIFLRGERMTKSFDKIAYNNKYNAQKYDSLRIVVPKGKKDIIKAYAQSKGESLNSFVNKAIDNEMKNK